MSRFCLVHGSAQGPAGWDLLVRELEARGHRCIRIDLPTDCPDASATKYAALIGTAVVDTESPIVVAHSASGLFLPLVPNYAHVRSLVYLAAVLPEPGESFLSQVQRDPSTDRPCPTPPARSNLRRFCIRSHAARATEVLQSQTRHVDRPHRPGRSLG